MADLLADMKAVKWEFQRVAKWADLKAGMMVYRWVELMGSMLTDLKEPLMAVLMVDHWVGDLAD